MKKKNNARKGALFHIPQANKTFAPLINKENHWRRPGSWVSSNQLQSSRGMIHRVKHAVCVWCRWKGKKVGIPSWRGAEYAWGSEWANDDTGYRCTGGGSAQRQNRHRTHCRPLLLPSASDTSVSHCTALFFLVSLMEDAFSPCLPINSSDLRSCS